MSSNGRNYIGVREIAKIAGVSTATVSRVINTPDQTSPKVREKVLSVIKEYNYVPNQAVKNLFSKSSNSIAIFIYDMNNPFFISLIKEVNKICFENKFTLLICDTENKPEKEIESINYCEAIRTRGIILTEGTKNDFFLSDKCNQFIVYLDRSSFSSFSSVASDNEKGIKMLVDYLYNLNHKKIAFAGYNESFHSSQERKEAFLSAMKEKDLSVFEEYIYSGEFDCKTGVNALDYYCSLSDLPSAVICANDQIARGMIMRANKLGVRIPDDISIVGYDNADLTYFWPKITTIRQDITQIAQTLFDLIVNPPDEPVHKKLDVSFIRGETCKRV